MTALQVSTVLACVNIISNGVAGSPLHVMERIVKNDRVSKRISVDHTLHEILHNEPNPEMTSPTWLKTSQCHALLWGNGYTEIQRDQANRIIALWPRNPARTRPVRLLSPLKMQGDLLPTGTMVYETTEDMGDSQVVIDDTQDSTTGKRRFVLVEDMIHVPGLSLDGRLGQSTVWLSRQVIGLALATEKYGAKFFGNGARPGGMLEIPGTMTPVALENLRRSFAEAHGGENAHKTGILEAGVKYVKVGANPNEGQFLETRLYQQNDIARVFGVPIHMVGDAGKSSGRSTVEQSAIEFVLFCLNPWLHAWEKELKRKLFTNMGRSANRYFPKFDTRKLMYPDAASRSKFYTNGKQWGYLCTNDVRELEDLNPVEDGSGDVFWMPTNMQDSATAAKLSSVTFQHLDANTLVPTPTGTSPVGDHPVAVQDMKDKKAAAKATADAADLNAKTQVAVAKATGQSPNGSAQPTAKKPVAKKPAKKRSAEVYTKAYTAMFRDAVGRATTRKKLDRDDVLKIFTPPLMGLIEIIHSDADRIDVTFNTAAYMEEVLVRSKNWTAETADAIAVEECRAAVTSVLSGVEEEMVPAYLMRHTTTTFYEQGKNGGWNDENKLSAAGLVEAQAAADFIKKLGIKRLVSSDLRRCKEMAHIIANVCACEIEYDEGLRDWHGIDTVEDIQHFVDNPDEVIPDGESLNELRARSMAAVDRILSENDEQGPTLIITSAPNIHFELGVAVDKDSAPLGSIWEFKTDDGGLRPIFVEPPKE